MSFTISVKHDIREVEKTLSRAQRKAVPDASRMALNRVAASVRSAAVKAIAAETGIKQKDVRAATTLRKAGRGRVLRAEIDARGRPLNLIRFGARQLKKSVSAKPWRRRRVYKRRVWVGNQGRTVFIREPGGKIRGMYGPSIAREMIRDQVGKAIHARFAERWPIEFERALNLQLRKLGFK